MNHFHEIERLSQSANPNLAVVTKIGTSHIGILGSRENIARAKSEIVGGMCAAGDLSRYWFWVVRTTLLRSSVTPSPGLRAST